MKRLVESLMLVFMLMMVMCGCGMENDQGSDPTIKECVGNEIFDNMTFACIAKPKTDNGYYVYVHKETRIIYLVYQNPNLDEPQSPEDCYGYYRVYPLFNIDGTPILYEGDL